MPPERFPPDDPREWLNRARGNLARARAFQSDFYYEDLLFDAQQAVEKAVKAVLISHKQPFPYIHDIEQLLILVERSGLTVPESVRTAAVLTDYAVASRYPASPRRFHWRRRAKSTGAIARHWKRKASR